MALQTKSISSDTTWNEYTLILELIEEGISNTENDSEVSWKLKMTSGKLGYDFSQWHIGWEIKFNDEVVSYCSREESPQFTLDTNSSITLISGSTRVKHNEDGTLNMSVSANTTMATTQDYLPGPMSLSGNMQLTTINRGLIYIDNGTSFDAYQAYIDNGTGWDLCMPYIDNGTGWDLCS